MSPECPTRAGKLWEKLELLPFSTRMSSPCLRPQNMEKTESVLSKCENNEEKKDFVSV